MTKRIVFCDFDGTITAEETFVGMLKQFATLPYDDIKTQVIDRQLSLGDGVRKLVESIPSECYPDILTYVRTKPLRKGFTKLLDLLHLHRIPFVVISGGLIDSVTTRLEAYKEKITAMHAARIDATGPYLRVSSEYEGVDGLVSKPRVAKNYEVDESAVIGDGVTDFNLARTATIVYARDLLAQHLDTKKLTYIKWRDFRDIRHSLQVCWRMHECNDSTTCKTAP